MRLVIFTAHYPYGNGEPFLEDEMRVAELYFEGITIVSYAKPSEKLTRYIPGNANVIELRRDETIYRSCLTYIKPLFFPRVWKELIGGCKERGLNNALALLKGILFAERHCAYIARKEREFMHDCDNTIYYSYWLNPAALYLSRISEKGTLFCVARTHGGDCFFSRGYVPWRKNILQKMDVVFPISDSGRKDIIAHYSNSIKGLEDKVQVARLGVSVLDHKELDRPESNEHIVVSCSNVIQLKRLDMLIEALSLISDMKIKWIHFGDGPLMKDIMQLATACIGAKVGISFEFKGRVSKQAVLDYYSYEKPHLFVNCSDDEGIPVSAMEAMSYGIPVVARDVGGLAELVTNDCGVLLPQDCKPLDLAEGIKTVLSSSDGYPYKRRSENAVKVVSQYYNAERNFHSFYDELIREKNER